MKIEHILEELKMENKEIYDKVFLENLEITADQLIELKYQDSDWDSVGHMVLMAEIEDIFKIEMDADDIIDFSSYQKGIEILAKYNIKL